MEWLDLMEAVQSHSDAWEAAYCTFPTFHPKLNFGLWNEQQQLIGTICGHQIPQSDRDILSVEVLAVHPQAQGAGLASKLIEHAQQAHPKSAIFLFWTRCPQAKAWYEKKGFKQSDQAELQLQANPLKPQQEDLTLHRGHPANIWCFALENKP